LNRDKKLYLFYVFFFVIFLGQATYAAFFPVYLSNAGMPSGMLGIINGIYQIILFFFVPIIGMLSDKIFSAKKVLLGLLVISSVLLLVFKRVDTIPHLAVTMVVFSVFFSSMSGIYEALGVNYAMRTGRHYNPIRMAGTIGYAVMSAVLGQLLIRQESLMMNSFLLVLLVSFAVCVFLPDIHKVNRKETDGPSQDNNVFMLLKNKELRYVLALFTVFMLGTSFNSTFFGIHLTHDLEGDYFMVGIGNALLAVSEFPFHAGPGRRWMKHMGIKRCMIMVMFVGAFRWMIASVCNNPWVFMMTMVLNGIMLVPVIVELVEYLHAITPEGLKTSAQTVLKAGFSMVGVLLANVVLGQLVDFLDSRGVEGIRAGYFFLLIVYLTAGVVGISVDKFAVKNRKWRDGHYVKKTL